MNDLALMDLHADILFRYDDRGRMLSDNDPEGRPAPRLFLGCSAGGSVMRYGASVPDGVVRDLVAVFERRPPCTASQSRPEVCKEARAALECHQPVTKEDGGPTYYFPESLSAAANVVQITEENVELARETYSWLLTELRDWWPCFAVVREGAAISVCFSARVGRAACEAGVDTRSDFRGRGYASAVTATWGAAIWASGRIPLYSTWWGNDASQAVARRLGLVQFGADATLT